MSKPIWDSFLSLALNRASSNEWYTVSPTDFKSYASGDFPGMLEYAKNKGVFLVELDYNSSSYHYIIAEVAATSLVNFYRRNRQLRPILLPPDYSGTSYRSRNNTEASYRAKAEGFDKKLMNGHKMISHDLYVPESDADLPDAVPVSDPVRYASINDAFFNELLKSRWPDFDLEKVIRLNALRADLKNKEADIIGRVANISSFKIVGVKKQEAERVSEKPTEAAVDMEDPWVDTAREPIPARRLVDAQTPTITGTTTASATSVGTLWAMSFPTYTPYSTRILSWEEVFEAELTANTLTRLPDRDFVLAEFMCECIGHRSGVWKITIAGMEETWLPSPEMPALELIAFVRECLQRRPLGDIERYDSPVDQRIVNSLPHALVESLSATYVALINSHTNASNAGYAAYIQRERRNVFNNFSLRELYAARALRYCRLVRHSPRTIDDTDIAVTGEMARRTRMALA